MYHSLDKRIWFTIIFLPLKESHNSRHGFYFTFTYFVPIGVIGDRGTKILSASMKMGSASAAIMYNSIESRHSRANSSHKGKGIGDHLLQY